VEHLTRIRHGARISEAIEAINIACCRLHRSERTAVILAPTNARVDAYNHAGLAALSHAGTYLSGETKGEFDLANDRLPVRESVDPAPRRVVRTALPARHLERKDRVLADGRSRDRIRPWFRPDRLRSGVRSAASPAWL